MGSQTECPNSRECCDPEVGARGSRPMISQKINHSKNKSELGRDVLRRKRQASIAERSGDHFPIIICSHTMAAGAWPEQAIPVFCTGHATDTRWGST